MSITDSESIDNAGSGLPDGGFIEPQPWDNPLDWSVQAEHQTVSDDSLDTSTLPSQTE